jgi:translocation and assembly module TamB
LARFSRTAKWAALTALFAGTSFLLGWLISSQLPTVKAWALLEVERLSEAHLPVRILPAQVDVQLLPPGLVFSGVQVSPKPDDPRARDLVAIDADQVEARLSVFRLLQGELVISHLRFGSINVELKIQEREEKSKKWPSFRGLFAAIEKIPIHTISAARLSIRGVDLSSGARFSLDDTRLRLDRSSSGLSVDLSCDRLTLTEAASSETTELSLGAAAKLSRDRLELHRLFVKRGDSNSEISGVLKGDLEALQLVESQLKGSALINLDSTQRWINRLRLLPRPWPDVGGKVSVSGEWAKRPGEPTRSQFDLKAEGLRYQQIKLGELKASVVGSRTGFTSSGAVLEHFGGRVQTGAIELSVSPSWLKPESVSLSANEIRAGELDLHRVLEASGVSRAPVWAKVGGSGNCEGRLFPNVEVECSTQVEARDIRVAAGLERESPVVVEMPRLSASGPARFTLTELNFEASASSKGSRGKLAGRVGYREGFHVDFESDQLSFQDVTTLGGLKFEGTSKLKGSTSGHSQRAIFDLQLDARDLWLEGFLLGNSRAQVRYADGLLTASSIQGFYTTTRYVGDVSLNFANRQIEGQVRLPFIDLRDALRAVQRKMTLPVAATGTGQAQVSFRGPFDIKKMSYELRSSLYRGLVAGENYDQAQLELRSRSGQLEIQRGFLSRGESRLDLTGSADPSGLLDMKATARSIRIEDSNLLTRLGVNMSGLLNADLALKGNVQDPDAKLSLRLSKTTLAGGAAGDSKMDLRFRRNSLEGEADLLSSAIVGTFALPYTPRSPFSLRVAFENWAYTPAVLALVGPGARRDFGGVLSGRIDLSSPEGGLWAATGPIDITRLSLSRGSARLENSGPIAVRLENGGVRIGRLEMAGDSSTVRVTSRSSRQAKMDLDVQGQVDINLLSLLTPFIDDLRGILTFKLNLKGTDRTGVDLLGSAYLDRAYAKLSALPHAFEDIVADLSFNQHRISFNSIRTDFAGGQALGSGLLEFVSPRSWPLKLTGTFDRVNLNIPDGIRTTGKGNFELSGSWFPWTLKLRYDVVDGLFAREFGGSSGDSEGIQRSPFIPKNLRDERPAPVLLDLSVNADSGIQAKNSLVDGRFKGQLSVKGDPRQPALLGQITSLPESKIIFRETVFDVISSSIKFENPTTIDPSLYITARTRKRSRDRDFEISLLIQGTARSPEYVLSSVPSLPQRDIITLLAIGVSEQDLQVAGSDQQGGLVAQTMFNSAISQTRLAQELKRTTGIEVQFSPGIDATDRTQVSRFLFTKRLTNQLEVQGSQTLGRRQETEAKANYRLTDRLSVIGNWTQRGTEESNTTASQPQGGNTFGVDLEYKFEFK